LLPEAHRTEILTSLSDADIAALEYDWKFWARQNQIAPDGVWQTWMVLAGRGFGKTEAGAHWVRERWQSGAMQIALIAETQKDLEEVMVPRLLSIHPKDERPTARFRPVRLVWPNGAQALGYNGTEPGQLRGPEFDTAWCFIAGTMVETPTGQVGIETLSCGDLVMTRSGPRPVAANSVRRAQTGKVIFANGSILVGTCDHPVYTSHGWTRLDSINGDDEICVSNAWSGGVPRGISIGSITSGQSNPGASDGLRRFIGKFIGTRTVAFQRRMISTILMEIQKTTILQTFWRLQGRITSSFIQIKHFGLESVLGRLRQLGYSLCHAVFAERPLSAAGERSPLYAMAAHRRGQRSGERSRQSVHAAVKNSKAEVATFVRSGASTFQRQAEQNVYCLAVEGDPEYFANGILVHNCDELAKYRRARELWDMLAFTMRAGDDPRVMVTTTPRPIPVIREIMQDATTVTTTGSTFDNAGNLPAAFLTKLKKRYGGTRLGRQELEAEMLEDLVGALWNLTGIDTTRIDEAPHMRRIVVAVDPSGTSGESDTGDSIGIVIAGKGMDGRGYVLGDYTCKLSPDGWGRRTVDAYKTFGADRVVAERNYGGAMVEHVIRTVDKNVSYKEVTASRGKVVRAEPIAALYEQCLAAGSMVTTERGDVPIELVKTSDRVMTRRGWRSVLWSGQTGIAETGTIKTECGRLLRMTPCHEVLTLDKWTRARYLVPERDRVVIWENAQIVERKLISVDFGASLVPRRTDGRLEYQREIMKNLTGCDTTSNLMGIFGQVATAVANCCTAIFTGFTTAKYLMGTTFTTSITTAVTMIRPTSLPSMAMTTHGTTTQLDCDSLFAKRCARSAAPHSRANGRNNQSALMSVGESDARKPKEREEPVYNLHVEDDHEFFANGILVHNCRISHVGAFGELEDQMCSMGPEGFVGDGSPDRVDALVWALTDLMMADDNSWEGTI